jgi:hypothetical protein
MRPAKELPDLSAHLPVNFSWFDASTPNVGSDAGAFNKQD